MKIITLGNNDYKVESKRTGCIYTVYALKVNKHNTITEYFIRNLGNYQWWDSDDFIDVKKKKCKKICSCCCQCIICDGDAYE